MPDKHKLFMRILIVTQYYWPEYFLINALSQKLSELGHDLTVVTGKPNYPEGKIYPGYHSKGIVKESYGMVNVIRLPLRPRGKGAVNLALNYFSFMFSGLRLMPGLLEEKTFDAVLVFAPSPITAAIPAIWLNRKIKSHLAIWVQDLWPQSLEATGYVSNKMILAVVGRMVRWIYAKTDTILAQSHTFEKVLQDYVVADKIIYYPNSVDGKSFLQPYAELPEIIHRNFSFGFNVVFTGNIGNAQSIPVLIEAASLLQDTDCRIIFVGDGSMLDWAKRKVEELTLSNVVFIGRVENHFMPGIYNLSDALLLSLAASKIFSYTIPSKLQSYLAAGKPIIASVNGEAADVVNQSGAGVVSPAEDSRQLAKIIRDLSNLPKEERGNMGDLGRQFFIKNFDMDVMAKRLVDIFSERLGVSK